MKTASKGKESNKHIRNSGSNTLLLSRNTLDLNIKKYLNLDNDITTVESYDYSMQAVLCKTCYYCEVLFTIFRRRHHCQLCGQLFCSRCTSFFIMLIDSSMINNSFNRKTHSDSDGQYDGNIINDSEKKHQHGKVEMGRSIRACRMCWEYISS